MVSSTMVDAVALWATKQDSASLRKHVALPGLRHSIGLARWWHLGLDVCGGWRTLREAVRWLVCSLTPEARPGTRLCAGYPVLVGRRR